MVSIVYRNGTEIKFNGSIESLIIHIRGAMEKARDHAPFYIIYDNMLICINDVSTITPSEFVVHDGN